MTAAAYALAAASLFGGQTPESERVRILTPFFSPPPGKEVSLDSFDVKERGPKAPFDVKGFISVVPPQGLCLTVRRSDDQSDTRVCKRSNIAFSGRDLHQDGSIRWMIFMDALADGSADAGTELRWTTPHRLGKLTPVGAKSPTETHPVLLLDCTPGKDSIGRFLKLHLSTGARWTIRFPDHHELIDQPPAPPNLVIADAKKPAGAAAESESGDAKTEHGEKKEEHGEKKEEHGEKKEEHDEKEHGESKEEHGTEAKKPVTKGKNVPPERWTVPVRGSYGMNSDNFRTTDGPPGSAGKCRYQLKNAPDDPTSGWIECHKSGPYDFVYAPLRCAAALKKLD